MKNLYAKDNFNLQSGFLLDPELEGLEAIFMISEQTKNCKQIDHFRLQHVIIKKKHQSQDLLAGLILQRGNYKGYYFFATSV